MAGPIRIAILGNAASALTAINATSTATARLGTQFKAAALAAAKFAAIGLGIAVAGAAYAAVKFAKAAAEDQQAAALMAKAFKNAAGATDAQVAATEKWISAQGRALGVTDDELRPALSKLVTATGDVAKAQELASLAMDVSAGSGKSLDAVSTALAKAQNGNIGGLGRLGIATKDAAGNTKTLAQITEDLGKKFGGAATTKANTLQGQIDRLKLVFSEAGEAIGYKLLPLLTRFAEFMLAKGIPAITKFGGAAKEFLAAAFETVRPVLEKVGGILTGTVFPAVEKVFNFLRDNKPVVIAFGAVLGIGAAALVVFGAAMAVVNAVLLANPIVLIIVALAALAAGLTYAYTKSETFRAIVDAAWAGIKTATQAVFPVVLKVISTVFGVLKTLFQNFPIVLLIRHWDTIREKTQAAWDAVKNFVSDKLGAARDAVANIGSAIKEKLSNAWEAAKTGTRDAWDRVKEIIGEKITAFMEKVNGIKEKVTGAFTGAAGWLYDAGKAVLQGLLDGLDALWEKLKQKIKDIVDAIQSIPGVPGGNGKVAVSRTTRLEFSDIAPRGTSSSANVTIQVQVSPTADKVAIGKEVASALDAYYAVGGRVRA